MARLAIFFLLLLALLNVVAGELHFDLVRARPAPPADENNAISRLGFYRTIFHSDVARQEAIRHTLSATRRRSHRREAGEIADNSSFGMPLRAGAYAGAGQYFVKFRVGTPSQPFVLVADTGSDLTWVKCRYQRSLRGGGSDVFRRQRPLFRADVSDSFNPISCSSEMCKQSLPFSLTSCPTPASPCNYDYGYSDGSRAVGFYANESSTITLSNGRHEKLEALVIGCTQTSAGTSFRGSDGVLGLGYSSLSFAARATTRFGGRFSYCLVDHLSPRNVTSSLVFGSNPAVNPNSTRSTKLILDPANQPFYSVVVDGISVGGELLKIPSAVWNAENGGGVILDSGTSLTVLVEPAYKLVTAALSQRLTGVPRINVDPFEFCYNWTSVKELAVPKMIVHFNGSAPLEPPAKSYLIDVADGVKCIGITSAEWPGMSTIGNILQQEHIWEYDIRNRRLRFQRSTCSRP